MCSSATPTPRRSRRRTTKTASKRSWEAARDAGLTDATTATCASPTPPPPGSSRPPLRAGCRSSPRTSRRGRAGRRLRRRRGRRRPRSSRHSRRSSRDLQSWLPDASLGTERPTTRPSCACPSSPTRGRRTTGGPDRVAARAPTGRVRVARPERPGQPRAAEWSPARTSRRCSRRKDAKALTPWTSGGAQHHLILRPLFPEEHEC